MSATSPAEVLLELLTLEEIDTNLYRAGNPAEQFMPHLYGGQVAAQALRAAAHTVPEGRHPHSIHGYFLRGGRPDHPTIMAVDRDRDGGSFSARHVNAIQDGEVIFSALASFHGDESGIDYQRPALPAVMRVLVLGAGFGGLELTTRLSEELGDDVDVVLIDRPTGSCSGSPSST